MLILLFFSLITHFYHNSLSPTSPFFAPSTPLCVELPESAKKFALLSDIPPLEDQKLAMLATESHLIGHYTALIEVIVSVILELYEMKLNFRS